MVNLTFSARLSLKETDPNQFVVETDSIYRREIYFFWSFLLLLAFILLGFGVYGAILYPGVNLGLGCSFILLLLVFLFAITVRPHVEIIVDPATETLTVRQKKIFLNELSNSSQTFSLASLQKPRSDTPKTIILTGSEFALTLRFKNRSEANLSYIYFNALYHKTHPITLSGYANRFI